jgi:transcriptional regulator with XRE-family HTH domain
VRPKNRRVLDADERIRIGTGLRRRRESLGLDQKDIAQKGKLLVGTMAVGTVQAIEYGRRKVTREKIDVYAQVVGATVEELLNPGTVQPTDPKWRDLNEDHLEIARLYMKARRSVRAAVEILLADETGARETTIKLAELVLAIKEAADREQATLWAIELLLEERGLMVEIARCVDEDLDGVRALIAKLE